MKTKKYLLRILGLALVFVLTLTGCPVEPSEEPGPPTVSPEELPELPAGSAAVTGSAGAENLLQAMKDSSLPEGINSDVQALITQQTTPAGDGGSSSFNFEDKSTTAYELKVTGKGSEKMSGLLTSIISSPSGTPDFSTVQPGDIILRIQSANKVTARAAKDISEAGPMALKVVENSISTKENTGDVWIKLKDITGTMEIDGGGKAAYACGWTVVSGGTAGKVVLNVTATISIPVSTIDLSDIGSDGPAITPDVKVTGDLKVYGADNKTAVYTKNIGTAAELHEALTYFGEAFELGTGLL